VPDLIFEKRDGIAYLTMNRPERRNAMSPQMILQLADAWIEYDADRSLRCAVLTGSGDEAFTAGGDLGRLIPLFTGARQPEDVWDHALTADMGRMGVALLKTRDVYKPIISAINGFALGGGTEIVLATDIRIASTHAVFGLPEPRSGIVPGAGSMARLPRQIPWCNAMEILLLADRIPAERALQLGLINEVVEPDRLMGRAEELARRIARNGPIALRKIKETAIRSSGTTLAEAFEIEAECSAEVMRSKDAVEGPRAFMEKREPRFSGE
jgi:enoyl-CoA hydratase